MLTAREYAFSKYGQRMGNLRKMISKPTWYQESSWRSDDRSIPRLACLSVTSLLPHIRLNLGSKVLLIDQMSAGVILACWPRILGNERRVSLTCFHLKHASAGCSHQPISQHYTEETDETSYLWVPEASAATPSMALHIDDENWHAQTRSRVR